MNLDKLKESIEQWFAAGPAAVREPSALDAFFELRAALEAGHVRAASPDAESPTGWRVNSWVKQGILLGFRLGVLQEMPPACSQPSPDVAPSQQPSPPPPASFPLAFVDKNTYPARRFSAADGVRVVPGGSSVRAGAFLARGVVCMPPMYINAGAYVDEGSMVDSHALVGSCAQIGKRVHLSAAAQVGGVLEPVNASPVIIEDDVFVGGNCGVYEGIIVRRGAVLAAGTILTRGAPVFDLAGDRILRSTPELPLIIPENAVVVPGARAVNKGKGRDWGLSLYTPVIVKYRDDKTDLSTTLEDLLR
jgi:2,3,4,5-tetrahydropyridine-2,6-dicarboxylate N-succinyltransferase